MLLVDTRGRQSWNNNFFLMHHLLSLGNIKCKNKEQVIQKLQEIKRKGVESLHLITDFDMTLTKYIDPRTGKRSLSSHGVLGVSTLPSIEFKKVQQDLYDKYYPIERDTTISNLEKAKYMAEWTQLANDAIAEAGFSKGDLSKMVNEIEITFRKGAHEFIQSCISNKIPVLIFSAGLGDIINELLVKHNFNLEIVHIVSNMMIFNENDKCIGFKEPLVHVLNKNETNIKNTIYYSEIKSKENVILLGDSKGDPFMSQGLQHSVELKIGYLNHDVEELLDDYLELYDVVLLDDPPMDFINGLLKLVVEENPS